MTTRPIISRNLAGGVVFLAVGGVTIWMASDLGLGNLRLVGPGAMPLSVGFAMIVLAIALIARTLLHPDIETAAEDPPDPGGRVRVAAVVLLIGLFILVLPTAGFLVGSFALMFACYAIGAGRPFSLFALVAALTTSAAAYALFVLILDVRLPKGLLGWM